MIASNPIAAKNRDGIPRVISVGRLSEPKDTPEETEQTLEAMRVENERFLASYFPGEKIVHYLGEQVRGGVPDRRTILELWELIESGEWDAVVSEDLARVFRNPRFQWAFVQDAVNAGIRVICFADALDTADESWEAALAIATVRHGLMIPDTRRRIKRAATQSCLDGGQVTKVKFGYERVSKEDAAAGTFGVKGLRMRRVSELTWVFDEIRKRLTTGYSAQSVVDWLNAENIPVGRYATKGRWTLKLLKDLLQDPILHGTRIFRKHLSKPIYRTGKYQSEPNPTPETKDWPELAFMTRDEHLALLSAVGWRLKDTVLPPNANRPSRKGIPRAQALWPLMSTKCRPCGDLMYSFTTSLKCRNSHRNLGQTCWNHVQVPIDPLRAAVAAWMASQFHNSPAFRAAVLPAIREQLHSQRQKGQSSLDACEIAIRALEQRKRNLSKAIQVGEEKSGKRLESLVEDLIIIDEELKNAKKKKQPRKEPLTDISDEAISQQFEQIVIHLMNSSYEMAEVIRGLVTKCEIVPVQAVGGGQVYPRAVLTVRELCDAGAAGAHVLKEIAVDLFDPPVHIRVLAEVVALRSQVPRPTLKQIGKLVGTSHVSVKRALQFHSLMEKLGAAEPFVELTEKPANAARWRHVS